MCEYNHKRLLKHAQWNLSKDIATVATATAIAERRNAMHPNQIINSTSANIRINT